MERNSFSILLLVLMVHLSLFKQFHFDIKLCSISVFTKFQLHILRHCDGIKPDKYLFYLCSLLSSLFDTVVASAISLLQYQLKYLSSKTFCEFI
jgi:hypothetical protein